MRLLLLVTVGLVLATGAGAREYGHYDTQRLLTVKETAAGKKYGFDVGYLDRMLKDLSAHAENYPPHFDTPEDRQRATRNLQVLSGMLDQLINVPSPSSELLARAARVNCMAYNLDIPGSGEKADAIFRRFLAGAPANGPGNYLYGRFLAGAGKTKEALPYLEKALSAGLADAGYTLGTAHLALQDKDRALRYLEDYRRSKPDDENAERVIDAIHNGRIKFEQVPN